MSIRINLKGVEEGGQLIAQGTYRAFVTDCEVCYGQQSGEPYIKLELRVDGGPANGRKLFTNCSLQEQALPMTKPTLRALGLDVEEDIDFEPSDVVGVECVIAVNHREYNGEKRPNVRKVYSIDEGIEVNNGEGAQKGARGGAPSKMFKKGGDDEVSGDESKTKKKSMSMFKKPKGE